MKRTDKDIQEKKAREAVVNANENIEVGFDQKKKVEAAQSASPKVRNARQACKNKQHKDARREDKIAAEDRME